MNLKKILSQFDRFNPKTDCLLMLGSEERFSFYAPDAIRNVESDQALPENARIALVLAYLAGHSKAYPELMDKVVQDAMAWIHRTPDA